MSPIRLQHALLPVIARPDDAPFVCAFSVASGYNPETAVESWVFEIGPRYGTRSPIFTSDSVVAVDGQTITVTVPLATLSDDDEDLDLADVVALGGCTWSLRARGVDDVFLWRVTGPVDFIDALEWDEESAASIGVPISINLGTGTTIALTILGNTASAGGSVDNASVNTAIAESPATTRTALGLGTLATQSGTFSGTSSGTNTGDQDLSTLLVKASNLSDLASASAARTNLGLGTLATQSGAFSGTSSGTNTGDQDLSTLLVKASNLSDLASASTARANLGLVIGTNVQAYNSNLTTWAAITPGAGIASALAIAVGNAGAPLLFNGAGGTPSSMVGTNITGIPAAGVVGTAAILGANTFTALQSVSFGIAATTQADGSHLTNTTAATNGNQTWSPSLRLTGNQWASSASRTCEFLLTVIPVQQNYDHASLRISTKHGSAALVTLLNIRNFNGSPYIEVGGNMTIGSSGANGTLSIQGNGAVMATFDPANNYLSFADAKNMAFGTTTGTKIGTATTQKIGFWNATPVVQQVLATGGGATVDNVISMLQTIGLCKQS